MLNYAGTENITPTNWLLKAAGYVVAKKRGSETKLTKPQGSRWKKKIKNKINSLRENLSHLDWWSADKLHDEAIKDQVGEKYKVKDKELKVVTEEQSKGCSKII